MIISNKFILNLIIFSVFIFTECFSQFTFVHITDIHVSNVSSINNSDMNGEVFSQMITYVGNLSPKPDFVVASGDISNIGNSGDGMYSVLTQYLYPSQLTNPGNGDYFIDAAQSIPIFFVPGNHEYYTTLIPPLPSQNLDNYIAAVAPGTDYYITHQNAVIIFVFSGWDQLRPIWEDYNVTNPEGSGISDAQCSWLRSVLQAFPNKKKIIVMHHPPVHALGTNSDGTPNTGTIIDAADGSIMNNRETLLNICDSFNVDVVLAGHVHQNVVADRPGNVVPENWSGGPRYVQTTACMYRGYRVITVDSSFVWLGTPQILPPAGITNNIVNSANVFYDVSKNAIVINGSDDPENGVELYTVAGQLIVSKQFAGDHTDINTGNIPKGMYLLILKNRQGSIVRKVAVY